MDVFIEFLLREQHGEKKSIAVAISSTRDASARARANDTSLCARVSALLVLDCTIKINASVL